MVPDKNLIIERLRDVLDPEIGLNIVELNMVRDILVDDNGKVSVKIALTVAHCPMAKTLQADVEKTVGRLQGVKSVSVETTAMSKKELEDLRIKLQHRTQPNNQAGPSNTAGPGINRLGKRGVRNIIAIVSGKGGVGKSFVTSMLATQLRRQGYEVGVLDADLTGPSIAKVFGISQKPVKGDNGLITPIKTKTGIKVMSINLILEDPTMPVIWRGPIVNSVIRQLYWDVDWGDIHYLLVDLPPGCVASGSQVFANPHPEAVEELQPGSHVYSVDASIEPSGGYPNALKVSITRNKVTDVIPQGESEIFELRTASRRIRATYNHPILAVERTRPEGARTWKHAFRWKRLAELKHGDVVAVVKKIPRDGASSMSLPEIQSYGPNKIMLPKNTSDEFCRIIGYFLGDGFVRVNREPNSKHYQVMFAEPPTGKHREKYVKLLQDVFLGARIYHDPKQFGIVSRTVAEFFVQLGLDKHALDKRVPKWVFGLPESQLRAVVEGYCDADGHRRPARKRLRRRGWMCFESPNRRLIEDMRFLAISAGLRVGNTNSRTRTLRSPSGRTYTRTFWGFESNPDNRSSKYGAVMIRGNGKQAVGAALANEYLGFEEVRKISHVGRGQVYDLTVEGNHNFISDGLVVHNTSDSPLTVFQSLPVDGVIVVSSPQDLAAMIVAKAVNMAKKMEAPIMGLVENMGYLECPSCREHIKVFGQANGEHLSSELGIPYLGQVPIDPEIARLSDQGRIEEYSSPVFQKITEELRRKSVSQVEQLTQGLPIAWALEPSSE